jgi:hypothetical protein
MDRIVNLVKKYTVRESPKVLGRWYINYSNKQLNNKIDLSNEDHCGPCGQYRKNISNENKIKKNIIYDIE